MKESSLSMNNWRGVWLSQRWWGQKERSLLHYPDRIAKQALTWCWGLWAVQMLHCLDMCEICQKYCLIMTPHETRAGPAAYEAAPYGGLHQVNQPFIMCAGSRRGGIALISRLWRCKWGREQDSCTKVVTCFGIIPILLVTLNLLLWPQWFFMHSSCRGWSESKRWRLDWCNYAFYYTQAMKLRVNGILTSVEYWND